MKRIGILAAVLVAGCAASTQNFEPTERVEGRTYEGDKVAIYPVTVGTGPVGEAKVWSSGAYKTEGDASFVRIGLDVHNTSSQPIDVHAGDMKLDLRAEDYGTINDLRPLDEQARSVPPGQTAETSMTFALPPGVKPKDVEAMRLDWQLHVGGQVYTQRTPFIEEPEPYYYPYEPYGPYGYMWPYGYGGWGIGYGAGFGYYGPVYRHHFHDHDDFHGHDFHGGHHDMGGHYGGGGNRTAVHPHH